MKKRSLALALGFAWLAGWASADEATPERKATRVAREAIKDFKFHPAPAPASMEQSPVLKSAPLIDAPIVMSPYLVRAQVDRTFQEVKEAVDQHERLKSPALFHVMQFDILIPPKVETSHAGEPRLNLGIIRLRF